MTLYRLLAENEQPDRAWDGQLRALCDRFAAEVTARLVRTADSGSRLSGTEHRMQASAVLADLLDAHATQVLSAGGTVLTPEEEARLRSAVLARVCGLGPLEALLSEPGVQNINITGKQVVVDFGGGRRERRPAIAATDEELVALVRRIAAESPSGERRFDSSAPLLSMELADGSRLSAVMGVSRRVAVAIRRHPHTHYTLEQLRAWGMVDNAAAGLLASAVAARLNILVAGATGAGKTTLLRALAGAVPDGERLVTVEDAFELNLDRSRSDCVALQARPANIDGAGEITLADLVRHALRLSPDRVIVGETRGPDTIALLNAMSMGTDGSMATIHASSSAQVFSKLAAYTAQSPERLGLEATNLLVASAVHLVVHIASGPSGERRVCSVREVVGADGQQVLSNEIYRRGADDDRGELVMPPSGHAAAALARAGYDAALRGWGR